MISSDIRLLNSLTSPLILIQYPSTEDELNDISPNFDQQLQQGSEAAAELNRQVNALDQQLQQAPPLDLLKDIGPLANQGQPLSLPEVGKQQQYSNLGVPSCENPPDECSENPTAVPSSFSYSYPQQRDISLEFEFCRR